MFVCCFAKYSVYWFDFSVAHGVMYIVHIAQIKVNGKMKILTRFNQKKGDNPEASQTTNSESLQYRFIVITTVKKHEIVKICGKLAIVSYDISVIMVVTGTFPDEPSNTLNNAVIGNITISTTRIFIALLTNSR